MASAYHKVAEAKARLAAIRMARQPKQALDFGGFVSSLPEAALGIGKTTVLGPLSFIPGVGNAVGASTSTGDIANGITNPLQQLGIKVPSFGGGGGGGASNPFVNTFHADAPTPQNYNFAGGANDAGAALGGAYAGLQSASTRLGNIGAQQQSTLDFMQGNPSQFGNVGQAEQGLQSQLQNQALGGGPNPAQLQYQQNVANQLRQNAGTIASVRGINPALAAELASQSGGQMLGNAAGNAGVLQAQQQLAAQGQLAGLQSQMGSQQLASNQQILNQQQALGQTAGAQAQIANQYGGLANQYYNTNVGGFGAQNTVNNQAQLGTMGINAGVASGNAQIAGQIAGGALSGAGYVGAAALAPAAANAATTTAPTTAATTAAPAATSGSGAAVMPIAASRGGQVPGRPNVPGKNTLANDTVTVKETPGEIVIPLSITQHPHAPYLAAEFVRNVLAGRGPKPQYLDEGGGVAPTQDEPEAPEAPEAPAPTAPNPFGGDFAANFGKVTVPQKANPNTIPPDMGTLQEQGGGGGGEGSGGMLMPLQNSAAAYEKAFNAQSGGLAVGVQAAEQEGAERAAAYQRYAQGVQQAGQSRDQEYTKTDAENEQLKNAYMNGTIDPSRLFNNASTGSKISAAIGVVLAGMGSGITGQPNMAVAAINRMVDEDVRSQYAELGKKQTLLSMNLQKYGRIDRAYAATMGQLHAVVEAQIGEAAANAEGPKAAAAAAGLQGGIQLQRAQIQAELAKLGFDQALGQAVYGQQGSQGITRSTLEQAALAGSATAKDLAKKAVDVHLPNGKIALGIARNEKDATEAQNTIAASVSFENQLDRGIQDLEKNGRSLGPADRVKAADTLHRALSVQLNEQFGLKRLSDTELKEYKEMIPTSTDWNEGGALAKYGELKKLISERRNAVYSTLSINGGQPLGPGNIKIRQRGG